MSALHVRVTTIDELRTHPNADALDIAVVGGWQCVVKRGAYAVGDRVVYFPPDTVLPDAWIEAFNVGSYTHNGRIRQAKLRGEPSFGLVVTPAEDWAVGTDVADYYGATKYQPPPRVSAVDAEEEHPLFESYTEVENMRSFPDLFQPGEEVVVTEKIHGTSWRGGIINGQRMAGSKTMRRKEPDEAEYQNNTYWFPWSLPPVRALLEALAADHDVAILFGEIYGRGVQKMQYDQTGLAFRAFDLYLDGRYLSYHDFAQWCNTYGVATVPHIATVPYSLETVRQLAEGGSLIAGHIREGVVVRPVEERNDPRLGRLILKYVGDKYLLGKYNQDDTNDV
jgi:RNA ligase (TIGR02306 family)